MSAPRLHVHPLAREELRAARRWYASRRAGLGRAFTAEVETVPSFALVHPEMYPAFDQGEQAVRRALLHRFPCALVYEIVSPSLLVVLACFDLRQGRAAGWQERR